MQYIDAILLNQLAGIISDVEKLLQRIGNSVISDGIEEALLFAIKQLNSQFYMSEILDIWNENRSGDIRTQIKTMLPVWKQSLERRKGLKIDSEFWSMYEYFKYVDRNTIISNAVNTFDAYPLEYKKQFITLPERYSFLTGKIDVDEGDYSLIPIYVDMMKENIESFKWLYERMADYRSKQILLRIVRFWFEYDLYDLSDLHENIFNDYYDLDLIKRNDHEILVDCGAYIGDSILSFIQTYGCEYQRIYGYEISPDTMEQMKENLSAYDNIVYRQKGVGAQKASLFIFENSFGAGTRISDSGQIAVDVVALDEDIQENITTIKMDIEGAEQDAIKGARRHILEEKPRLLICTYHRPEDLFEIPKLIDSIRGDYSYYLRFNGRGIWPCDHVLFAI